MRTILITGTSRGIGAELCLAFAEEKYRVISISRKENPLFKNIDYITHYSLDISNEQEIETFAKLIKSPIDIIIHNAGKLINKPLKSLTMNDFEEVYRVNVFGIAMLTKNLISRMPKGGHVVTISSMGGIQGSLKFPGLSAYSSSKGAVITLAEVLAEEYKEEGISFNTLALGAVQTEMLAEAFPDYQAPLSAKEMAGYIKKFSLNENKFYNGKVLEVSSTTP